MGISYGYDTYTFAKNIQGDVIGIYSGGTLVAKYEYNAYGQILSITNASGTDISNNASHIANINPFRYRGYYYDTETGFYYLQSRYYDPVVGRFLNADAMIGANGGIIGYNAFAYCNNNPIRYADYTGCSAQEALEWWKNYGWVLPASDSVSPAMDIVYATVFVGLGIITIFEDDAAATPNYSYDSAQTARYPQVPSSYPAKSIPITLPPFLDSPSSTSVLPLIKSNSTTVTFKKEQIKNLYKCKEVAETFKRNNYDRGNIVLLIFHYARQGFVGCDKYPNQAISQSGKHYGYLYNGIVRCNIYPEGLAFNQWINSFYDASGLPPEIIILP